MMEDGFCKTVFLATGCNRTLNALSWGKKGLIAFGGCNSVYVYNPESECFVEILNGHGLRVNCVCWLSSDEIVSGSSDKSLIVWRKNKIKQTLLGHTDAVCSVCSCCLKNGQQILVSSSSDSSVNIWSQEKDKEFVLMQTLTFGNGFALAVSIVTIPETNGILLACGCDDTSISLFTNAVDQNNLIKVLSLKGHEDWIRCLTFVQIGNKLLLASGSQDSYIRLWKISPSIENVEPDSLAVTKQEFIFNNYAYLVSLESVLVGHENWVYGLSWYAKPESNPILLSASMDKSLIIWEYDETNEIWLDKARMGDVGGNSLGFYGCAFSPCGNKIIAYSYQGAFQMWKKDFGDPNIWKSEVVISGHFDSVEDFDWDPMGEFAVTTSVDQTTRVYAPWRKQNSMSWHEIARAQIHGYDMKCLKMISRYRFASGAQEKVVRIFSAPKSFFESLSQITGVSDEAEMFANAPLGATVPVLGLSNKAVYLDDLESWQQKGEKVQTKASTFANEDPAPFNPDLINNNEPPVEDLLSHNTLWPETQKLYGHGFELYCLTSTPSGDILATACKASKPEHASIIIWNALTWKQTDTLTFHTLTVTQMEFSVSGKYLLSVSRDRLWAIHVRNNDDKFSLVQCTDKKTSIHTRIIWSCSWFVDENYFVTASRDKKIIVWSRKNDQCKWDSVDTLDVGESATSVCVDKKTVCERYVVAVGMETGAIQLYFWNDKESWNLILKLSTFMCPTLSIKQLRWRPGHDKRQLGIAASDHTFRILSFNL
ncbi:elongator complex protein 2 isoform X2 [Hydra vulgaris]|uniref:Elongator complex protein 2 n=1 Tax=Hydra vulgaris TaxID=6087 RepID=A0ABM4CV85_HYDVU